MANNPNPGLSPPPLQMPVRNGSPADPARYPDDCAPPQWAAFFNALFQRATILQVTQANLPTNLGAGDIGRLVYVTDYGHVLMWTGTGWTWGPGDEGSGKFQLFEVDPTGAGWHLYDGSTVSYLKSDGTLGSVTLPDLTSVAANAAYPKAGSPNGGPNAAVAPTLSGSTDAHVLTNAEIPSHAHGLTQIKFSTNYTTTGGSVGLNGTGSAISQTTDADGGGGGHSHTLGAAAVSATGEPRNIVRRPWFRQ